MSDAEDQRDLPKAKDERQQGDFGHHHRIIGVLHESIGPAATSGSPGRTMMRVVQRGQGSSRTQMRAQLDQDPNSGGARTLTGWSGANSHRRSEPCGVQRHDQRIVARGAPRGRPSRAGVPYCASDSHSSTRRSSVTSARIRRLRDHAASSIRPAQVKPGPKAVIRTRSGRPCFSSRSSTNITVGALILP